MAPVSAPTRNNALSHIPTQTMLSSWTSNKAQQIKHKEN